MPATNAVQSTTQQFLDIYDITNDLLILKDGSTSLILSVNAINFGLFAEEEQDAVIYSYASLLNSLNYSIQIVVKSQTKDVTAYLQLLKDQEDQTQDQLKKERIKRYRGFVSELIHEGNVLDKKFYVAIPANALEMGLLPPQTVVPGIKKVDISSVERSVILQKAKDILEPKRDHLIGQFARIGLQARQLVTQEIIQLFYTSYNPEAAEGLQVTDTRSYTTPLVNAQLQTNLYPDTPTTVPTTTQGASTMIATDSQPTMPPAMPTAVAPTDAPLATPVAAPAPATPTPPTPEPLSMPANPAIPTPPPAPMAPPAPMTPPMASPSMPAAPAPVPGVPSPMPTPMTPPLAATPPTPEAQVDIDAALKELTPAAPAVGSSTPAAAAGAMPPLPEI